MATYQQLGFSFDQSKCTGCKACQIACKDKNDLPVGVTWRRVAEYTGGGWVTNESDGTATQDVYSYYTSVSCNHCEDAICMEVCPTTAMRRGENGIVYVDQDICIGCKYCAMACPYSAPQYNADKGVMSKCDFCMDRIAEGGEPACVASCPTRALAFGEIVDLRQAAVATADVAPLPKPDITRPNLVVLPHPKAKPSGSRAGAIGNPEEI